MIEPGDGCKWESSEDLINGSVLAEGVVRGGETTSYSIPLDESKPVQLFRLVP